ncbi:hypothetical protein JCM10512_4118 [Bacteroides reticulotermitis JCM 10512]|uniref:Uncharacterized protein n=1 Tax=Bacteroides reticulotermitis JCM 10512 TaxID=1445607 RepID=W4UXI6_9BACE|nr:hypothetical protein JCM10512_4118 [Bacteroides reticulotermitis JCM 10512]
MTTWLHLITENNKAMKTNKVFTLLGLGAATAGALTSCNNELLEYQHGDIQVVVEKGDAWLHDFPLFLGIEKKNPPQIAMWIEDMSGKYISTIYVTHKIATESWQANKGNRRKERCLFGVMPVVWSIPMVCMCRPKTSRSPMR